MVKQSIVGWAHSPFGKSPDPDVETLIGRVAGAAIENAGLEPGEIDAVFVGNLNSGFAAQDFPASLAIRSVPALRYKPATTCSAPATVRRKATSPEVSRVCSRASP